MIETLENVNGFFWSKERDKEEAVFVKLDRNFMKKKIIIIIINHNGQHW